MADQPRPLVAGNWKMNGLRASIAELEAMIADTRARTFATDLMICPPATLVPSFAEVARGSAIAIGAQDCHAEVSGAFTGDLSAEMLKDAGASAVIVGHSERRGAAWRGRRAGEGQSRSSRPGRIDSDRLRWRNQRGAVGRSHNREDQRQLEGSLPSSIEASKLVIAYEPVWAIGTGLTPTPKDVAEVHEMIRKHLVSLDKSAGSGIRILYGGSVKPQMRKS